MDQAASSAQQLHAALRRVIELRRQLDADSRLRDTWRAVKRWQAERLRRTYADLLAQPRLRPACEFFLAELYGAKDFSQRDQEALRVVPMLARMLPERAVTTMLLAVELDELSERLDERVARNVKGVVDDATYAAAYRAAGTRGEREHQIDTIDRIGRSLERLARIPFLAPMLHMMRGPAEVAGLGQLHRFLQSGFDAFVAMGAAGDFLDTVRARETLLMQQLFDGGQTTTSVAIAPG
jgi:hypothetical protein